MSSEIEQCIHFIKVRHAVDIFKYSTSFLEKIITDRMNALGMDTGEEYFSFLETVEGESAQIMDYLSNSYSEFFRNPLTFNCIEQIILPGLIHHKLTNNIKEIRIWSAACASGQEAYSFAMVFDELIQNATIGIDCLIFATDINPVELDKARKGVYNTSAVNKVSLKRIQTYFTRQDENYSISPYLKKYIDFSEFDLLSKQLNCPPASIYGNFDLIFCSNLLFYYNLPSRQRILHKVGNCLAEGGYLICGETEVEMVKEHNYREVFVNSGIFQKR